MKKLIVMLCSLAVALVAPLAFGQDDAMSFGEETVSTVVETVTEAAPEAAPTLDKGDTAWMITASVLVLFMTLPGLALFYGGLVRSKNVLSLLVQCFAIACVMTLLWIAYGYSFAAGENSSGFLQKFIGNSDKLFLKGINNESLSGSIPETVFVFFQMTFAIITPALIVGAFAERMKFSAVLIFTGIWFTLSYLPVWHMAWGSGLFADWGVLDFAGGTVVHINAGIAGLVAAIALGKRTGYPGAHLLPHNVPLVVIGASMLWVGWFGFNAGSELAADGVAGMAALVTQIATATAAFTWMICEWVVSKKPTAVGIATGAVAGLVAITPASGTAGPMGALIIGIAAGAFCYLGATKVKRAFGYDDSLDVFGVHGIGGIVGALLTGLCAAPFLGGAGLAKETVGAQIGAQFASVLVTIVWSAVAAVIGLIVAKVLVGLRVSDTEESTGLDTTTHGEAGYNVEA